MPRAFASRPMPPCIWRIEQERRDPVAERRSPTRPFWFRLVERRRAGGRRSGGSVKMRCASESLAALRLRVPPRLNMHDHSKTGTQNERTEWQGLTNRPSPGVAESKDRPKPPPRKPKAERRLGGVHREIRRPQARVAPRSSNSAPKRHFNMQVGTPSHQRNPTRR